MKKSGIILISAVIVAIHMLVLFLTLAPGASEEPVRTDAADLTTEEPIPEPEEKAEPIPEKPPVRIPVPEPGQKPEPVSGIDTVKTADTAVPLKGKFYRKKPHPLNRSKAIRDIPGIKIDAATYKKMTGIMLDPATGKVLWQKASLKRVPIASLTKIMTLVTAYEAMLSGESKLSLSTQIPITNDARNVPPSGVRFQPEEKSFPLEKLMLAAAVKSANDATYLIAQAFGNGSADDFVRIMNKRAKELGMTQTVFYNPHGLPGQRKSGDNMSTVTDVIRMCEVYLTYPELTEWASMRTADFRKKGDLVNHNHLLKGAKYACDGVTGIKTGFTNRAGFCLAAVCTRNGRTLLLAVTGFSTAKERDTTVRKILDWGFKQK